MRKRTALVAIMALAVTMIPITAMAAVTDGAGFAADCNADGRVDVSGHLRVLGGSGDITTDCLVVIDHDSTLVFRDTSIGDSGCSSTCFLIVGSSGENSVIRVINSTIDVSGPIQLSAGCCSGGEFAESNGKVRVADSTIVSTASSVEISASVATDGGRVVVRRSTISGVGNVSLSTFTNGVTIATNNDITSGSGIHILSGFASGGDTTARRNTFTAPDILITASGGSCLSVGNTPAVACS